MNTHMSTEAAFEARRFAVASVAEAVWRVVRLPLLAVLTLFEPLVRYLFSFAMVLGICASVMFEISAVGPRFPFLVMLAGSLGCALALFLYCALIGLLTR